MVWVISLPKSYAHALHARDAADPLRGQLVSGSAGAAAPSTGGDYALAYRGDEFDGEESGREVCLALGSASMVKSKVFHCDTSRVSM